MKKTTVLFILTAALTANAQIGFGPLQEGADKAFTYGDSAPHRIVQFNFGFEAFTNVALGADDRDYYDFGLALPVSIVADGLLDLSVAPVIHRPINRPNTNDNLIVGIRTGIAIHFGDWRTVANTEYAWSLNQLPNMNITKIGLEYNLSYGLGRIRIGEKPQGVSPQIIVGIYYVYVGHDALTEPLGHGYSIEKEPARHENGIGMSLSFRF